MPPCGHLRSPSMHRLSACLTAWALSPPLHSATVRRSKSPLNRRKLSPGRTIGARSPTVGLGPRSRVSSTGPGGWRLSRWRMMAARWPGSHFSGTLRMNSPSRRRLSSRRVTWTRSPLKQQHAQGWRRLMCTKSGTDTGPRFFNF